MNRMDKRTGDFRLLEDWQDMASNHVKSLVMDGSDNLWVSMFKGGIEVFDAQRRKTAHYKRGRDEMEELLANDVRKTVLEGDSGLWVAYQYSAPVVSYLSFGKKKLKHISLDSVGNYDHLFDVMRQGDRTLWAISNKALKQLPHLGKR